MEETKMFRKFCLGKLTCRNHVGVTDVQESMLFMDVEQYIVKVPGCFPVKDSVQRMAVVN
jgi:hypothetical protein